MHDPMTMICSVGPFTLWHNDPCSKPGCRDDSCGWFMRASHGDPDVLAQIIKDFEWDWDRVYRPKKEDHDEDDGPFIERVYHSGFFYPVDGTPHFSNHGVVLNLFFTAAHAHFSKGGRRDWDKASRFMRKNLFDILFFAENPSDSLHSSLTRKFEIGEGEGRQTPRSRQERIESMAAIIYGWILRAERPWYKHPCWHVHHWSLQVSWRWFLPRWLHRRMYPECYASSSTPSFPA